MIVVAVALAIAAFLAVFLVAPVASVFYTAFASGPADSRSATSRRSSRSR